MSLSVPPVTLDVTVYNSENYIHFQSYNACISRDISNGYWNVTALIRKSSPQALNEEFCSKTQQIHSRFEACSDFCKATIVTIIVIRI